MRRMLSQCARLLPMVLVAAACRAGATRAHERTQPVNVNVTCSGNQIKIVVNPSRVTFKHTGGIWPHGPTDVPWALDARADVPQVTIAPDGEWPFESPTPPAVPRGNSSVGVGRASQAKGMYRYSITASCPGGPTGIFDPDIWVD